MPIYLGEKPLKQMIEGIVDDKLATAELNRKEHEALNRKIEEQKAVNLECSRKETLLKEKFPLFSKVCYLGLVMTVRGVFIRRYPFISDVTLCVSAEWVDKHDIFQHREFHDEELDRLEIVKGESA